MNVKEEIVITTVDLHWLTKDQAWHYRVLPRNNAPGRVCLYCSTEADTGSLSDELEVLLGLDVELFPIQEIEIAKLLSKYYLKDNAAQNTPQLKDSLHADNFLTNLISEAKKLKRR